MYTISMNSLKLFCSFLLIDCWICTVYISMPYLRSSITVFRKQETLESKKFHFKNSKNLMEEH